MFGDGSEFGGAQQQSGAPEHSGIGAEEQSGAPEHSGIGAEEQVPIVQVAFRDDKWWSIPQEISAQLYDKYVNGQDAEYIRIIWVRPQDVVPQFTGQLPTTEQ